MTRGADQFVIDSYKLQGKESQVRLQRPHPCGLGPLPCCPCSSWQLASRRTNVCLRFDSIQSLDHCPWERQTASRHRPDYGRQCSSPLKSCKRRGLLLSLTTSIQALSFCEIMPRRFLSFTLLSACIRRMLLPCLSVRRKYGEGHQLEQIINQID